MKYVLTILLALFTSISSNHAQDMGPINQSGFYITADSAGIQQVYQLLLDGQSEPRQITTASNDVITFSVAYDGLAIAYISGGQLWLQPIHTESAEALATLTATQFFSSPVFSQDSDYLAYADNGVWLLNLATRESTQILVDVPFSENMVNISDYRAYTPKQFVMGTEGKVTKLIVTIGIWEWMTTGVYDLGTGDMQVLEGQIHSQILPIYGGKVLLFGNGGMAGEFALHLADSLDDINTYTKVVDFSSLTNETLFATQAIEIAPGTVRILGDAISTIPNQVTAFYFDYDLMANTASAVRFIPLSNNAPEGMAVAGNISPSGNYLPIYTNALYTDFGTIYGDFSLLDLTADTVIPFPATIGMFRWQP